MSEPVRIRPQAQAEATAEPVIRFASVDRAQRPVIVLGAARSGTSAMSMALRRNTRYIGYGEGHLVHMLPRLLDAVDRHYMTVRKDLPPGSTMLSSVPVEMVHDGIRALFVEMARNMAPTGFWTDKTPGPQMVRAAPALRRIWPEMRVIFMRRPPIENVESRRRKFPEYTFRSHCMMWADSMIAWDEVRAELAPISLEVDQVQLLHHPEIIVGQLTRLLTLSPDESERLLDSFINDRPQVTGDATAPPLTLETVGWSEQQRETFLRICGDAMHRFGYDTGALLGAEA
jgi:hypothetical protein